jgi:mannosyltransferase
MGCARPAIVTRLGALPELVAPGHTGTVVAPGHPRALATALASYLAEPDLARIQGKAALARFDSTFPLDRCATRYLQLARCLQTVC